MSYKLKDLKVLRFHCYNPALATDLFKSIVTTRYFLSAVKGFYDLLLFSDIKRSTLGSS